MDVALAPPVPTRTLPSSRMDVERRYDARRFSLLASRRRRTIPPPGTLPHTARIQRFNDAINGHIYSSRAHGYPDLQLFFSVLLSTPPSSLPLPSLLYMGLSLFFHHVSILPAIHRHYLARPPFMGRARLCLLIPFFISFASYSGN